MTNDRKIEYAEAVLAAIAMAGIIALAAVAPNSLLALKPFLEKKPAGDSKARCKIRVSRALGRLIGRGCVAVFETSAGRVCRLTRDGERMLARVNLKTVVLKKSSRWDRRWRMVSFDIREIERSSREALRRSLKRLGLRRMHDSVWMYPHDCREIVELLRIGYRLRKKDVRYLVSDRFDGDEVFARKFRLKIR